jgi:hypothetical protein
MPVFGVSISHTAAVAVAVAAPAEASATGIGIDVERIEPRSTASSASRSPRPSNCCRRARRRPRHLAHPPLGRQRRPPPRLGLGLKGRPKAFEVTDRAGGTSTWPAVGSTRVVCFGGAARRGHHPTGPREVPWRSS